MKPERLILGGTWLLLAAGFMAWATGAASMLASAWIWLGAFGVLALPLLLWLLYALFRGRWR